MQKLRSVHLYLGCLFAPMLIFFGASGLWQTVGFKSKTLALLSTIHTSRHLKMGGWTNPLIRDFVIVMTVAFLITTLLGVMMALKHGRSRKVVYVCLALGIAVPVLLILLG
jgi:hypothetical protein